jgi:predicted dehydrogenase
MAVSELLSSAVARRSAVDVRSTGELRAGVIGTGRIAVQHLSCLHRLAGARTVAVCDLSLARAEAAAARWGVPAWYGDHRRLLAEQAPHVVHVTTPPESHLPLALDALAAGAHVIVEKPAALDVAQVDELLRTGRETRRHVVESYTYLFSDQVQRLLALRSCGAMGDVVHVDVSLELGILDAGSAYADPNLRHPALDLPGGAISDFLTHLASLVVAFAGPHRALSTVWRRRNAGDVDTDDELRALVDAEEATATLSFSANARPEGFLLRVDATRLHAVANLFETRLTVERVRDIPRPLATMVNGLAESRDVGVAAVRGLLRKLGGGPGSYEGLWTLIERTYAAISNGQGPPVAPEQIRSVNRLVADLVAREARL